MVIYRSGMAVEGGLYWSPLDGQRVDVTSRGVLPGGEDKSFLRISPLALLVMAPLFGLMFIMFLPLFGIGVFFVVFLVPLIATLASVAMTSLRLCCRGAGAPVHYEVKASRRAAVTSRVRAAKVKALDLRTRDGLNDISVG
jgi:hypothetical protein